MIIKPLENENTDIEILTQLLSHPDASGQTQKDISLQIKKIKAGIKGEKEAAYELDFYFGKLKNWAVIHNLRLDFDGLQAQIDHVLINRFLEIYLIESKHYANGIAVNEHGEFVAFYGNKSVGIASPIEQGNKHKIVLEHCIKNNLFALPKRLGMSIKPSIKNFVLISKNARIQRHKNSEAETSNIIKADQFYTHVQKSMDSESFTQAVHLLSKTISRQTLKEVAQSIAHSHTPIAFDWHTRFNLEKNISKNERKKKSPTYCQQCGVEVDNKVRWYCIYNKDKYANKIYCRDCQPLIRKASESAKQAES